MDALNLRTMIEREGSKNSSWFFSLQPRRVTRMVDIFVLNDRNTLAVKSVDESIVFVPGAETRIHIRAGHRGCAMLWPISMIAAAGRRPGLFV